MEKTGLPSLPIIFPFPQALSQPARASEEDLRHQEATASAASSSCLDTGWDADGGMPTMYQVTDADGGMPTTYQ